MALHQINLRIEEGLLGRFKAEAAARGISANTAAGLAFEGWLTGSQAESSSGKQTELADVLRRLEVLEQKLAQTPHGPTPAAPAPPAPPVEAPPPLSSLPPRRLTHDEAKGLITTKEVVQALGLASESSLTNWIARNGHEGAIGKAFKGYLLLGKGLMPGAGKPVWLWRHS